MLGKAAVHPEQQLVCRKSGTRGAQPPLIPPPLAGEVPPNGGGGGNFGCANPRKNTFSTSWLLFTLNSSFFIQCTKFTLCIV